MVTGRIHSFQSMGAVDGPGLRYVVFLQGCPARCAYCHNPDTWDFFGGTEMTPEEVVQKILRYRPYLKKGGVTLTGGEPLMQPDFSAELFRLLKAEGLHTALDTSGVGDLELAKEVLANTDLVLADVKFLNDEDYLRHTGIRFSDVRQFLDLVRTLRIPMWVRHVVVPELNDNEADIQTLLQFLQAYPNTEKVELLPFRTLCLEKYETMGIPFPLKGTPALSSERLTELQALLPEQLR